MLEVSVSIPLDREDWSELDSELREQFAPIGDTGIGLGYSDINFPVRTREKGEALKAEIIAFFTALSVPAGDTQNLVGDGTTVIVAF